MAITTTSLLPAPVQQSFSYKLLSVPVPYMIHNIAAMNKRMPRNGGTTLRMRRYNPLPTSTVPLGNSGLTPPASTLSAVDIDATIDFYGQYILINEQVTLQDQDPVLNEAAQRLGVALRQTEDELTRDMLLATASQVNAVGGTNGDNPTDLARSDIDSVIRTLLGADAKTIEKEIGGEDKFGTGPVRDSFLVMANTDLIGSLDNVDGFIAKTQYPSSMSALRPEYCSISNTRWMLSSIGSVSSNASLLGANVYNCFVTGMESYTVVEQDGYSAQFVYRPPVFDGPLALNCSVGYKFASAQRITNDEWIINLRVTI